ncbi:MAG: sensor histidine kinase [Anaerolineae bacterium]
MPHERVLVTEDEADIRSLCAQVLTRAGYQVVAVGSGHEAIEHASKECFDLLITDIKMPGMSGLEAYSAIRPLCPNLVAVVMTGYATLDSAIEALKLGVYEFVLKPFLPDELVGAAGRALSRQRLERENARLNALLPLFDLSRVFMSTVDLETVPKQVVRIACSESGAEGASLVLLNGQGHATSYTSDGWPPAVGAVRSADDALARHAIAARQRVVLDDDSPLHEQLGLVGIPHAVAIPLIQQDKVLGALSVYKTVAGSPFTQGDVEFLAVLGSQAAVAIENARMFSEIQDAYQRLAELDHLKSEFISIAAHELRSPLAVVLAYATLLEEEATGAMRSHLGQVVQAAMQLRSIIDEMVSLRHIDTGEAQVAFTQVDVAQAVDNVLRDLHLLAEPKHQHIEVDLSPGLNVRADEQVLHLILSSLLSNAIKFTPEGGEIRVEAAGDQQEVIIAISDTGVGIPQEELERVFQRFYQVEGSLRRRHGGMGLGLAIAREMAELLGSRIWARSAPGQGSTFYLALPIK